MTSYTREQVAAATYCWEVLQPRAKVYRTQLEGLPWWRFVARGRALRGFREAMDEWEAHLRAAGLL